MNSPLKSNKITHTLAHIHITQTLNAFYHAMYIYFKIKFYEHHGPYGLARMSNSIPPKHFSNLTQTSFAHSRMGYEIREQKKKMTYNKAHIKQYNMKKKYNMKIYSRD